MMTKLLLSGLILTSAITLIACNKPKVEAEPSLTNESANTSYVDNEHTAENSLDWHGVYGGVLPCADCPGIKTTLTLNSDKTYSLEETYQERDVKPLIAKGSFNFDQSNTSIIVLDGTADNRQFFIGEGFAEARAMDGSEIEGTLKEHYKLNKTS